MMRIQTKMTGIRLKGIKGLFDGDTKKFLVKVLVFFLAILMIAFTLMGAISD